MIFFNGGWMSLYDGIGADKIVNGGAYIEKHGFGGEVYNFRNSRGRNYGYVMTKSGTLDLSRIDPGEGTIGDFVDNVTCIFVATHPKEGRRIVGWYRKAKIYSRYQIYNGNDREIMTSQDDWNSDSKQVGFFTVAKNDDVIILTEDERLGAPIVPKGKGGFGQSNVWYADSEIGIDFRRKMINFISEYESKVTKEADSEYKREKQSKVDIEAKQKVEVEAINRTRVYFEELGYQCESVESDNCGWDLECINGNSKLLVEVKGLSQSVISVMLTRNEYEKMRENRDIYRLSVVTNCLDQNREPSINIFSFISEKNGWFDKYGHELDIEEIVLARCELKVIT
jgi:hypothetical protein